MSLNVAISFNKMKIAFVYKRSGFYGSFKSGVQSLFWIDTCFVEVLILMLYKTCYNLTKLASAQDITKGTLPVQ